MNSKKKPQNYDYDPRLFQQVEVEHNAPERTGYWYDDPDYLSGKNLKQKDIILTLQNLKISDGLPDYFRFWGLKNTQNNKDYNLKVSDTHFFIVKDKHFSVLFFSVTRKMIYYHSPSFWNLTYEQLNELAIANKFIFTKFQKESTIKEKLHYYRELVKHKKKFIPLHHGFYCKDKVIFKNPEYLL